MEFKNVDLRKLKRPEILLSLFKDYFHSTEASSSHWRFYGNQFEVDFAEDSFIRLARGIGFGEFDFTGLRDRFLNHMTILSYLLVLPDRFELLKQLKVARQLGLPWTYDVFRQGAIVSFLKTFLKTEPRNILIIGDGGGVLTSFLKMNFPHVKMTSINLGKVLFFENLYLQKQFPQASFALCGRTVASDKDFNFIPAEAAEGCDFPKSHFDLAINVSSMQEMTQSWISYYFKLIRLVLKPGAHFYCCNRVFKKLLGGEVTEIEKFPWKSDDKILIDEEPRFYRWFFAMEPTERRPHVVSGKIPVPYGRLFDGEMRHRFVEMAK